MLRHSSLESVYISFDLCMSGGCKCIFDLIANGDNKSYEQVQIYLVPIDYENRSGQEFSIMLFDQLEKYQLANKFIACVKDHAANIESFTGALRDISSS